MAWLMYFTPLFSLITLTESFKDIFQFFLKKLRRQCDKSGFFLIEFFYSSLKYACVITLREKIYHTQKSAQKRP
jgi:hypothetical protein